MENLLGHQISGYKVQTPVYEGPLDLLLSLIERAELNITAISLAAVTDQYLSYLHGLEQMKPDEISSFLVIAAKLVQIKSEALLPRPIEREPGEEDPGVELVELLILYKRYKEIAGWMMERQENNLRTYLRVAPPPKVEAKLDLSNLTLEGLLAAAESAFSKGKKKEALGTIITAPRVTIREKIEFITKTMRNIQRMTFSGLDHRESHAHRDRGHIFGDAGVDQTLPHLRRAKRVIRGNRVREDGRMERRRGN